jgi:hypothetical protein
MRKRSGKVVAGPLSEETRALPLFARQSSDEEVLLTYISKILLHYTFVYYIY